MACKDCLNGNCNGQVFSDKCVKYTGDGSNLLGLCNGDSLSYFEEAVIEQLESIVTAKGITLTDLTSDCTDLLSTIENSDKTLYSIIQILIDKACTLSELTADLNSIVGGNFNLSASCIDLSGNLNLSQILQTIVTQVCKNSTNISTIAGDYVKASELTDKVNAIISANNDSTSPVTQYNLRMVPYVAYPYHGSLSNFDSNGIGYSTLGFTSVYICNGSNGTPDYRGRSSMGANTNVPGTTMDSTTNPNLNNNSNYSLAVNGKMGAFKDTLTVNQVPAHTHTATQDAHFHLEFSASNSGSKGLSSSNYAAWSSNRANGNQDYDMCNTSAAATIGKSSAAQPSITVNSTGGGSYHNTTHPVIGCNFIMYIPS